jgi:23S rRNA (adenine-N6)-dimethyltransferase
VIAAAIVRDAGVCADDLVLDIGAGSGRLTAPLAARGCRVTAIELDPAWAQHLRRRFAGRRNVTVVEADAQHVRLPAEPFHVVANLPFGGGTGILRRLLDRPEHRRADVILEWPVAAKRAACWPSTMLGVCWGVRYELVLVRRLPAACFEPRPTVDAGLLRIVRRPEPLVPDADHARFCAFVRAAFDGDRGAWPVRDRARRRAARIVGIERSSHPRDLDVHQWAAVFAAVRPDV